MAGLIIHSVTFSDEEPSVLSESVRSLFLQYVSDMKTIHNVDLSFQDFQTEVSTLPGKYDFAERGGVWVALLPDPTLSPSSSPPSPSSLGPDSFTVVPPHSVLPGGRPFLSTSSYVGVIALRPLGGPDSEEGEVKRLYVAPAARGRGVGRALAKAVVQHAERKGYRRLKLDSLERLGGAIKVYEREGFERCDKYCECPEPDHFCMNLELNIKASG